MTHGQHNSISPINSVVMFDGINLHEPEPEPDTKTNTKEEKWSPPEYDIPVDHSNWLAPKNNQSNHYSKSQNIVITNSSTKLHGNHYGVCDTIAIDTSKFKRSKQKTRKKKGRKRAKTEKLR
eukprot:UN06609